MKNERDKGSGLGSPAQNMPSGASQGVSEGFKLHGWYLGTPGGSQGLLCGLGEAA